MTGRFSITDLLAGGVPTLPVSCIDYLRISANKPSFPNWLEFKPYLSPIPSPSPRPIPPNPINKFSGSLS